MQTHDGHYVTLRADAEGVWFDLETDTGERVNECLPWREFHEAYSEWLKKTVDTVPSETICTQQLDKEDNRG